MADAPGGERSRAAGWQDRYRERWKWDRVFWGTHCVDCYPGNCPYRVYMRDGRVCREEIAGTYSPVEAGVPDRNPSGCQKGAAWSQMLDAPERVLYPLKRAGERGGGKWQRVSWDQALTEIAEAILNAIQELGPESIIHEMTPAEGGEMAMWPVDRLLVELLGGLRTDVNAVINDFQPGHYLTWGKFNPVSGPEDRFHAELALIWHSNPVYTQIPGYHYRAEGRYKGCEVITIAPDYSPSAIHADAYVPIRAGTDAALALAMCEVIIEEGLYDGTFVREQTDLPLLVRRDNRRFLRESDLRKGGLEDQFYLLDAAGGEIVEAPRDTLALGDLDAALAGSAAATLADGTLVEVEPLFAVLRRHLGAYTPEKASAICGVHPEIIRTLARKAAAGRTVIGMGMNLCKYYHGDLIQRAMLLVLGLTANWGRAGSGIGSWSPGSFEGPGIFGGKERPGPEETARILEQRARMVDLMRFEDPTWTDEMAAIEGMCRAMREGLGNIVAPAFLWYDHCGYRENWNRREWGDPAMKRSFDEYMQEARGKGWWQGADRPGPAIPPRVLFEVGGNFLRRQRGGQTMLLTHLWPKLKMIVSVDWRMSTTGLHSDYVLPAAQHYEKVTFHIPNPTTMQLTLSDKAVEPAGESKSEWEIFRLLARKIEERARERRLVEYADSRGRVRRLDNLYYRLTLGIEELDELVGEWIEDTVAAGCLEKGTSLATIRERGFAMFKELGRNVFTLNQASDIRPGEPFTGMRWHVEDKVPYPTLTRRAQFYIDHPWFFEAGEELPVHKENPKMGGEYPFVMTSGHNRWSIHSMNITNRVMLATTSGGPRLVMNSQAAAARGIENGEEVRVFNNMGSFSVRVKTSPAVRPDQVIIYNGWEPYMFRGWQGPMEVEPGMVKWLHLAGGYGHLRYWPIQWQPVPIDRAIRVDVARLDGAGAPG